MVLFEILSFLHFVGLALGVGCSTAAAVIAKKADKDPLLGKEIMKVLPSLSKLIWLGLILLIISGIGLGVFAKFPVDGEFLAIKHVLVVLIIVFGAIIWLRLRRMRKLAPTGPEPSPEFLKAKRQIKVFSSVNLILWYLVVLLAVFL